MANPQASQTLSSAQPRDAENGDFRIVNVAPQNRQTLDRALEETFPASDPVSITISQVVRAAKPRNRGGPTSR